MGWLYYSNGGPGPASRLLRINEPNDDHGVVGLPGWSDEMVRYYAWMCAPAEKWTVRDGWQPYRDAQGDISQSGWFGMIDESEVNAVQQQMCDSAARYA